MELGEPEAVGTLDDHHRGVGHVHTDLDDGGRQEYLCFARDEATHGFVLLIGLHLTMYTHDLAVGEVLAVAAEAFVERAHRLLFALLDHGEDDIGLTALLQLALEELIYPIHLALTLVVGLDRLAPGWELVDDGDIEIAIEGHGERTWDRRSAHDEDVWVDLLALLPQPRALHDTEAVLLVDDCQPEMGELYHGL